MRATQPSGMIVACVALVWLLAAPGSALALEKLAPGNIHAAQPAIPGASVRRTTATKSSFDAKYAKIRDLIASDTELQRKIRGAAADYDIDPIHIVGALVGEHTYNVDAYDRMQTYYVKAMSYAGERFRFEYNGESITDFVARAEFADCAGPGDSLDLWTCRERVWNRDFRGKTVDGSAFPNDRFSAVFFQPFFAGQTFGLGQLNPLTALMITDRVARRSGLKPLEATDASGVYQAIMDPDSTLAYMAAYLHEAIEAYRKIAGFNISNNPGITATLYNVGNPEERAAALAAENRRRKAANEPLKRPEENYYGWLVNEREAELRSIIGG